MPGENALPTMPEIVATVAAVAIVLVLAVVAVVQLRRMVRRWMFGAGKTDIRKAWSDVEGLMARNDTMSARLAVMHADAVLDKALQARHFPGDRFATRLQFAQRKYPQLRRAWWAHKLRNDLAHEPDRALTLSEARKAVAAFATALKELSAM